MNISGLVRKSLAGVSLEDKFTVSDLTSLIRLQNPHIDPQYISTGSVSGSVSNLRKKGLLEIISGQGTSSSPYLYKLASNSDFRVSRPDIPTISSLVVEFLNTHPEITKFTRDELRTMVGYAYPDDAQRISDGAISGFMHKLVKKKYLMWILGSGKIGDPRIYELRKSLTNYKTGQLKKTNTSRKKVVSEKMERELRNPPVEPESKEAVSHSDTFESLATQILALIARMERLEPNLSKVSDAELMNELQRRMKSK